MDGDMKIENELMAANIDAWRIEIFIPLAVVRLSLGQDGNIEAQGCRCPNMVSKHRRNP